MYLFIRGSLAFPIKVVVYLKISDRPINTYKTEVSIFYFLKAVKKKRDFLNQFYDSMQPRRAHLLHITLAGDNNVTKTRDY